MQPTFTIRNKPGAYIPLLLSYATVDTQVWNVGNVNGNLDCFNDRLNAFNSGLVSNLSGQPGASRSTTGGPIAGRGKINMPAIPQIPANNVFAPVSSGALPNWITQNWRVIIIGFRPYVNDQSRGVIASAHEHVNTFRLSTPMGFFYDPTLERIDYSFGFGNQLAFNTTFSTTSGIITRGVWNYLIVEWIMFAASGSTTRVLVNSYLNGVTNSFDQTFGVTLDLQNQGIQFARPKSLQGAGLNDPQFFRGEIAEVAWHWGASWMTPARAAALWASFQAGV